MFNEISINIKSKKYLLHIIAEILIFIFTIKLNYFNLYSSSKFFFNSFYFFYISIWIFLSIFFNCYSLLLKPISKGILVNICKSFAVFFITNYLILLLFANSIKLEYVNFLISTIFFFAISILLRIILSSYFANLFTKKIRFNIFSFSSEKNICELLNRETGENYFFQNIKNINSKTKFKNLNLKENKFLIKSLPKNSLIAKLFWFNYSEYLRILDFLKLSMNRYPIKILQEINLDIENIPEKSFYLFIKRIFDILLSIILLIVLSPLIFLACTLVYIEDQNNVFYSQIRTGLNSKKIKIYKIRTMIINAEENGPQWSSIEDKRITKIGSILRLLRIDELPQLISVIKGDLSLIGPRPERPELEKILSKEIPFYMTRYSVRPGLSGWAQVNYPYGASKKDAEMKLSYDLFYIKNNSFFLDIIIFFLTIKLVLNARGAKPTFN